MRAIFGICGSESKPGLQLAETLATPDKLQNECLIPI